MPAADLKTAQAIAHATAEIVEDAVREFDQQVSAAIDRGDTPEARRLGALSETLSREAERLRGI